LELGVTPPDFSAFGMLVNYPKRFKINVRADLTELNILPSQQISGGGEATERECFSCHHARMSVRRVPTILVVITLSIVPPHPVETVLRTDVFQLLWMLVTVIFTEGIVHYFVEVVDEEPTQNEAIMLDKVGVRNNFTSKSKGHSVHRVNLHFYLG